MPVLPGSVDLWASVEDSCCLAPGGEKDMSVTLGDKTKTLNRYRETHTWSQAVGRQVLWVSYSQAPSWWWSWWEEYFCPHLLVGRGQQGQQWRQEDLERGCPTHSPTNSKLRNQGHGSSSSSQHLVCSPFFCKLLQAGQCLAKVLSPKPKPAEERFGVGHEGHAEATEK